jgi:phospholipid/cholesterol/gamma-HCH transport system permease protein
MGVVAGRVIVLAATTLLCVTLNMHDNQDTHTIFSKGIDDFLARVYRGFYFFLRFFKTVFTRPFHTREIIHQGYEIGLKSLSLISLTGFVIGIVFTKQSRPSLEDFGAVSWLPSLMGIAIIKALGPLVTAIICAGKVGSSIGAELGSMQVTEQMDAMEVSAVNPYKYLVVTRVIATTLSVPILSMYCSFVGLTGAYFNVHASENTGLRVFIQNAFSGISFLDIYTSIAKTVVYGFTIGMVGAFKGYHATQGTRGVGKAANEAVVLAMFLIFLEEILIVQVSNWFRNF